MQQHLSFGWEHMGLIQVIPDETVCTAWRRVETARALRSGMTSQLLLPVFKSGLSFNIFFNKAFAPVYISKL